MLGKKSTNSSNIKHHTITIVESNSYLRDISRRIIEALGQY